MQETFNQHNSHTFRPLERGVERSVNPDAAENVDDAMEKINSIIDKAVVKVKALEQAKINELITELIELDEALHKADEKIAKMPRSLRNNVLNDIRPYRQYIMARRYEILNHPGVKITFMQKLIDQLKKAENFGDLSRIVERGILLGLLTAGRNQRGNISFPTVAGIEDERANVYDQLIVLVREIQTTARYISIRLDKLRSK